MSYNTLTALCDSDSDCLSVHPIPDVDVAALLSPSPTSRQQASPQTESSPRPDSGTTPGSSPRPAGKSGRGCAPTPRMSPRPAPRSRLLQLREEYEELGRSLRVVAAEVARVCRLAESVRQLLVEAVAEARAEGDCSSAERELECTLRTAAELQLVLQIEPSFRRVAIGLPPDATVAMLREAVHQESGLTPVLQELSVGGRTLMSTAATPLSGTGLVRPGVCVVVRPRDLRRKTLSLGNDHGLAILRDGEVVGWGQKSLYSPMPAFDGAVVSVHAGFDASAAVVGKRLVVWGAGARFYESDLRRLDGKNVVCCSITTGGQRVLAAVDSDGHLHLCGPDSRRFERGVRRLRHGSISAASASGSSVAVLYREGGCAVVRAGREKRHLNFGGRKAVSISAGSDQWDKRDHCVVLLDDGSVRCFGNNDSGQCDPPRDLSEAVSCAAGRECSTVCCRDGNVVWWGGKEPCKTLPAAAGPFLDAEVGHMVCVGVRVDHTVVCDGRPHGATPDLGKTKVMVR